MDKKINVNMAALNPYVEDNIIKPIEKDVRGQGFISWGDGNIYPNYLYDLYGSVATLQSIINGCVDYVKGDEITSNTAYLSQRKAEELVEAMAFDIFCYGNTALNVIRDKGGKVSRLYTLDMRNLRSDKKNNEIYYSEDYGLKSYGRGKYIKYPVFNPIGDEPSSIYWWKNRRHNTYGLPCYASVTKACEIEKKVDEYHLNSINNGFVGSVMINFANGVPSDEVKEEITEMLEQKYTGAENASRVVVTFNDDKDHLPTISKIETDDVSSRYADLVKRTREQIFTAFRATPNLFGVTTESLGFNSEEYASAFKLFNKTVIAPVQKTICNILDEIFGENGSITIKPFTIKFEPTETKEEIITS